MLKAGWGPAEGFGGCPVAQLFPQTQNPLCPSRTFQVALWSCLWPQAWLWAGSRAQQETAEDSLIG